VQLSLNLNDIIFDIKILMSKYNNDNNNYYNFPQKINNYYNFYLDKSNIKLL